MAAVRKAMRFYHADDALTASPLRDLYQVHVVLRSRPALRVPGAIRAALDASLARLRVTDPDAAALLRWRFVEREPARRVAKAGGYFPRSLAANQARALHLLAADIWKAEREALESATLSAAQRRTLDSLPSPTYTRLFGVGQTLGRLKDYLRDASHFWFVALDGLGGVGKTALARAAAEDLVREGRFERIVWVMARQHAGAPGAPAGQMRPALTYPVLLDEIASALLMENQPLLDESEREAHLRMALSQLPTLIIVDNLETVADIEALVAGLGRLAQPTKVLVTTRVRLPQTGPAVALSVRQLERRDALDAIEYWARSRDAAFWLSADQAGWQRLAELTDDHPLAIKVALALTHTRPLETVLEDLALVRPAAAGLYDGLLRYAWEHLSDAARHLLMHFPLLDARGAPYRHLVAIAGESPAGDWAAALKELGDACLLDAGYVQGEYVYSIHRLIEHFVLAQIGQSEAFAAASERAARHWLAFWQANGRDRQALQQTRGHATRALLWCAEGRHCPEVAADLAVAMHSHILFMGSWHEWEPCLRRVVAEIGPLVDGERHYELISGLAVLCYRLHRLDEALSLLEQNVELAHSRGDRRQLEATCRQLAETHLNAGDYGRAQTAAEGALAVAGELGDPVGQADGLIDLARALLGLGRPAEARAHLQDALALAQGVDDARYVAKASLFLGHAAGAGEAWEEALEWFQRALRLVESYADEVGRGVVLSNIGWALTRLGQWDAAGEALDEADAIHHLHGNWPAATQTQERLAELARRRHIGMSDAD